MSRPAVRLHDPAKGEGAIAEPIGDTRRFWRDAFVTVRIETERRAAPLSPEDQVVQSMPDASPAKWHRAHITWFFEQFLLRPFAPAIVPSTSASLICSIPTMWRRARVTRGPQRGLITRPGVAEITAYRAHVDAAVMQLIETDAELERDLSDRRDRTASRAAASGIDADRHPARLRAKPDASGLRSDWQMPPAASAAKASPRCRRRHSHRSAMTAKASASTTSGRRIKCCFSRCAWRATWSPTREWLEFMADGGYATPTLWLSDGWAKVEAEGWHAPGYWQQRRRRLVLDDARRLARRSIRQRRSAMSATTRPTRSRAGPASICRPKRNGRSRRAQGCSTMRSASCGNGPAAPICPIRVIARPKARSANTTASS